MRPPAVPTYSSSAFLISPQVYTLGPAFRAEASHTRHHLAEFYMLEAESIHLDTVDRLCTEIEAMVRSFLREFCLSIQSPPVLSDGDSTQNDAVPSDQQLDLALVLSTLCEGNHWTKRRLSELPISSLITQLCSKVDAVAAKPFPRITYYDAVNHLTTKFGSRNSLYDFSKDEERHIVQWFGGGLLPVFVTHFPTALKPFYCRSLDGTVSESVDLLFPDVGELVGGSVRECDAEALRNRLSSQTGNSSALQWYINLRGSGSAPHGGFGLGFERFMQYVLSVPNIRDVIPFPRDINRIDL
ncbi:unnamed protein product [Dicrocoelium dendriticum]|nr:unnamed protein product [Dicrocoelium dendriticum]